jgi:Helix-turn-helix domain of resolvase/Resolvase, N terminal domain
LKVTNAAGEAVDQRHHEHVALTQEVEHGAEFLAPLCRGARPLFGADDFAPGGAERGFLGTAAGKCFLDMLGVFAEFETNLRKERQLEGIAKAKAEGVYKGRPASIDVAQVRAMKTQGMGATAIAKALNIHRASVYRLLEEGP